MTETTPPASARQPTLDETSQRFVEEFGLAWEGMHSTRMEGRVIGLLMIIDEPYLSSAQIGSLLRASAGAVSTSTRRLGDAGFIKRHMIPGDRSHYFRVEDDIWGGFLAGERAYLVRLSDAITTGFATLDSDEDHPPRRRLTNARNYMTWLAGYHRKMLADWEAYRDALPDDEDSAADAALPPTRGEP
ncbi:GbsR/MarR family transcriptional regulator [Cellulomonas timonensis]|uniref:GbsR/MarR family transcriptional regulator n=1 Tax=Cellulomonas timonensis TaxID=1689271 RepID=UPI000AD4B01A|nr:transcriptional regulator [Cellulomonas timonensis]